MSNPIPSVPLYIQQGDDFRRVIQFSLNGSPADLTNWTAQRAQMRRRPKDPDEVEFAVAVESVGSGLVSIALTAAQTAALEGAAWVWDLERVVNGAVRTVVRGPVTVTPDVTRVEV